MTVTTPEMPGQKILLIDDDAALLRLIQQVLSQSGYAISTATNGAEGLRQFEVYQPDLVILDLIRPDLDGWQTCRQLRQHSHAPILMLTALSGAKNIIRGLEEGADDYLEKPVDFGVLVARVRALLRRVTLPPPVKQSSLYGDGYLTIDLAARQALINNQPIELSKTEFELLAYLSRRAGQVCSYQQLLAGVWEGKQLSVDVVHQTMRRLRQKLSEAPEAPRYLLTEYGLGYRFKKLIAR